MATLPFDKVHACGNDFVLIERAPAVEEVPLLCDRHHGIGADGILVLKGISGDTVFLDHHDPDGSRSFCLNGARAALNCLRQKSRIAEKGRVVSESVALDYEFGEGARVYLEKYPYQSLRWPNGDGGLLGFQVQVGNPQFVILEEMDPHEMEVVAPRIRADTAVFPEGTNVSFPRPMANGWRIRTFERGVECFTKACGTGMHAASLVLMGERQVKEIRFFPDGMGSVRVVDLGDRLLLEGGDRWVASGVWRCGV